MRPVSTLLLAGSVCALSVGAWSVRAQPASLAHDGPYKILATTKVGGSGGFDYVSADSGARRLYVPRPGEVGRVDVFNLDTLAPLPGMAATGGHGVVVDQASGHGFVSSKPVVMFDAKTGVVSKSIEVQGNPDGIFADPGSAKIYVLSHSAPNVTVIDAQDGSVAGTIDLGGAPEQAQADGKGHLFIDLEDKAAIAVVDTKTLKLTGTYSLAGTADGCAGLAIDRKNGILFAACREPAVMVVLKASDGTILTTLPIGKGSDGATFNPRTMEAFSAQSDGTLTVVKESSPTSFAVAQTLATAPRAKTLTLDEKTGKVYLITAEFGTAPAPQPGQRPARAPMVPDSFKILTVGK